MNSDSESECQLDSDCDELTLARMVLDEYELFPPLIDIVIRIVEDEREKELKMIEDEWYADELEEEMRTEAWHEELARQFPSTWD